MRRCWMRTTLLGFGVAAMLPSVARAQTASDAGTAPAKSFSSEALKLRLSYPGWLEQRSAAEALTAGQIKIMGLTNAGQEAQGSVAACLRPLLLARTPEPAARAKTTEHTSAESGETTVTITPATAATLLLAELDTDCLSGEEQVSGHKELPVMAQQFLTTPGMAAVAQPASYNIGWQKVYMAAAQGHPQDPRPAGGDAALPAASTPFTIFTMAIATNWNNHLLVWLMSSNQVAALDAMSKSKVRFGRSAEAPLYPRTMGNATAPGSPQ